MIAPVVTVMITFENVPKFNCLSKNKNIADIIIKIFWQNNSFN